MRKQPRNLHDGSVDMQSAMVKVLKMTGTALLVTSIGISTLSSTLPFTNAITAKAETITGTTENGFNYILDSTKNEVTITGYSGNEADLIIPNEIDDKPVTVIKGIGSSIIKNTTIKSLKINENLKSINQYAFANITNLATIDFSDATNLELIDSNAFYYDTSLASIDLSNCSKLVKIADNAFFNATSLNLEMTKLPSSVEYLSGFNKIGSVSSNGVKGVVTIPDNVTELGSYSFDSTVSKINKINLNPKLKKIDSYSFQNSFLKELIFPENSELEEIGDYALDSPVGTLIFPSTLKKLGSNLFTDNSLTDIKFNEGLQYIGSNSFTDLSTNTLILPSTLLSIGDKSFSNDSWRPKILTKVLALSEYVSYGTGVFNGFDSLSIYGYRGSTTETEFKGKGFVPLTEDLLPSISSNLDDKVFYNTLVEPIFNIKNSTTNVYTLDGSSYDGVSPITSAGSHTLTVQATNDITTVSKTYNFTVNQEESESESPTTDNSDNDNTNDDDSDKNNTSNPSSDVILKNLNINALNKDYRINVKALFKGLDASTTSVTVENLNESEVSSSYDDGTGVLTLQGLTNGFSSVNIRGTDASNNKSSITFLVYVNAPITAGNTGTISSPITTDSMTISDTQILKGQQYYTVSMNNVFGDVLDMTDVQNYVVTLSDIGSVQTNPITTLSLKPLSFRTLGVISQTIIDSIISNLPSGVSIQGSATSTNIKASVVNNQLLLEGLNVGKTKVEVYAETKSGFTTSPVAFNLNVVEPPTTEDSTGGSIESSTGGITPVADTDTKNDKSTEEGLSKDDSKEPSSIDLKGSLTIDEYKTINANSNKSKVEEYNANKDLLGDKLTKSDISVIVDITNKYGVINKDTLNNSDALNILDSIPKGSTAFKGVRGTLEGYLSTLVIDKANKNIQNFKNFVKLALSKFK